MNADPRTSVPTAYDLGTYDLAGKTAIVTGATRGIGHEIATQLARSGARVAVCGRDQEQAARQAARLPGGAVGIGADLVEDGGAERVVATALDHFGSVDLLVNNAGISLVKPSLEVTRRDWQEVLETNLTAAFFSATAAVAAMPPEGGAIVNIASIAAVRGLPQRAPYAASKAALIGLTRVQAVEWGPRVRVNAIVAGYTRTDIVDGLIRKGHVDQEGIASHTPLARLGRPQEIASAVVFLLSDAACFITGETLAVDGGWTIHGAFE